MAFSNPDPASPAAASSPAGSLPGPPRPVETVPAVRSPTARERLVHEQYLRAQVETASPIKLILMLYDGAIRFLTLGLAAMERKDMEAQNSCLVKTQRILSELLCALDRKVGGAFTDNLASLYFAMLHRLVSANIEDDAAAVREVLVHLQELRTGWQMAAEALATGPGPAVATAPRVPPDAASQTTGGIGGERAAHPTTPADPQVSRLGDRRG